MGENLFVYGSLRKGLWGYNRYLQSKDSIGPFKLYGFCLYTTEGLGYPFIIPGEGAVTGEIFEINQQKLAELDEFEDCPRLYTRNQVNIEGKNVWVYVYTDQNANLSHNALKVDSGDWLDYLKYNPG